MCFKICPNMENRFINGIIKYIVTEEEHRHIEFQILFGKTNSGRR